MAVSSLYLELEMRWTIANVLSQQSAGPLYGTDHWGNTDEE